MDCSGGVSRPASFRCRSDARLRAGTAGSSAHRMFPGGYGCALVLCRGHPHHPGVWAGPAAAGAFSGRVCGNHQPPCVRADLCARGDRLSFMKLQGVRSLVIGDLYIPCAVMRQAVSRLSPGHLEALEWKVADLAELQDRPLLLELHVPDAAQPPDGVWEYLPETEFLMTHLCPVNRKMIEAAPNLRYLGVCRGGMDTIDHKAIQKRRIRVFNAPGRNANAVAEMTVALMLVEARNIARAHASLAAGRWRKEFGNDGIPGELRGKVIGLIGFGAIGRRVAEVL